MKDELQQISDFFELGVITETEEASGNSNRNSYITTSTGKYLIKIIEERNDASEVASEIPYVKRLKGNLKIIPYIENQNGESLFHKDKTIALAQPFVENIPVERSEAVILQLVEEQARLHQIDPSDLPQRQHWINLGYIARALKEIEENNWMANTEVLKNHPAATQDWSSCESGIIHGDLHLSNTLFNQNKELLAIIDWEEVGIGHYVLDFAITISAFCFDNKKLNKELLEKMISVYEKERLLSDIEKQLLDIAIQRAFITAFVWKCLRKHRQGDETVWDAKDCNCFTYF
ncbi:phosphotransferase [Candidatus Parcubacteria bacterium]|nr:phosphotransferase [Candidatus Parcubacteria bacterium]